MTLLILVCLSCFVHQIQYEGSQLFRTPPFATATLVYALYCDGGSWAGNAKDPVIAKPNSTGAWLEIKTSYF